MSRDEDLMRAVVGTIAYCDQFHYPLSTKQLERRLLDVVAFKPTLDKTLTKLLQAGVIVNKHERWALAGSEAHFAARNQRALWFKKKLPEIQIIVRFLSRLPWVEAVALTGALAMANPSQADDDIDLMIVTTPNRLWLTRPIVVLWAMWHGKRRSWQGEERNSWCFNLWVEPQALRLPQDNQTVYSAYEVIQARWLVDKSGIKTKFLWANAWIQKVLPNYFRPGEFERIQQLAVLNTPYKKDFWVNRVGEAFWDYCNLALFKLQLWYMRRHMTRERVAWSYAFFHPRDTRQLVETRWLQAWKGRYESRK